MQTQSKSNVIPLTVILTQRDVTRTLPSGRVLTLSLKSLPHGTRYVMQGGYWGRHDIDVDPAITDADRLAAHWQGYVMQNLGHAEEHAAKVRAGFAHLAREEQRKRERDEELRRTVEALPRRITLRGPGGVMLTLNSKGVVPHDPGAGEPAVVTVPFKGSSTYWCCKDVGHVSSMTTGVVHDLTKEQQRWLDSATIVDCVEAFVSGWTKKLAH